MAKGLKSGLSTGTCAAAAVRAACLLLSGEKDISRVDITLPGGDKVFLAVHDLSVRCGEYRAYVFKDGGDDPDETHGLRIGAGVRPASSFAISAGPGVGIVTRPGLAVPMGSPAVNPVPREMIKREVERAVDSPVHVRVLVPRGREIAARTFNPRLGIVAGISILGTTGRVRPFSLSALRETVRLNMCQAGAYGIGRIVLVPGNIGRRAASALGHAPEEIVEVGNEWGYALDILGREGPFQAELLGHPGKLLKLACGEFDTHSKRSASALPFLRERINASLGRSFTKARTVQAILEELDADEISLVLPELAGQILQAAQKRSGGLVRGVHLIDLGGKVLGSARN